MTALAIAPFAPFARTDMPPARTVDLRRMVGAAAWLRLPSALRRRFEGHEPAHYAGTMSFSRSTSGAAFAWLAKPFGAPLPTGRIAAAPVSVDVSTEARGVVWDRLFGAQRVRSLKIAAPRNRLIEQTDGGLGMVLDVSVQDGALVFTSRAFFISLGRWRVPIPNLFTPGKCRVEHRDLGDGCFRFFLTMTHPLFGTTFVQDGLFSDGAEAMR